MCRNTPKMYDLKSKDNQKIYTPVVVPLFKGMYELWETDTNSWNNTLVAAFKIIIIGYADFILNIA